MVFDPNVSVDLVQNTHHLGVYIAFIISTLPMIGAKLRHPLLIKVAKSLKIEMSTLHLSF